MASVFQELVSLRKRQQLMYFALFSLMTVMVWVGISLLLSQQKTQLPADLQELAKSLNPSINTAVLENIKSKKVYTEAELSDFPIYKIYILKDGTERVVTIEENESTLEPTPTPPPVSNAVPNPVDTSAPSSVAPIPPPQTTATPTPSATANPGATP